MNGTLINYFFHCKRQCYLHAHKLKTEHTSDLVKLGKYYHKEFEEKDEDKKMINGVKIDKIEGDYLIEYKKSNSDVKASEYQLLFYLWKLKQAGIIKTGKLKFKDNRDDKEVNLTLEKEKELEMIIQKIKTLINSDQIPPVINKRKCRKCAYFEFCYS
ncbi:CRISPR-associated protein Cas4 [Candidatus Dojkabacteria bacterium]|nr:CRISPR-associated protein Cas4 [Candidatus Dojkabacteria bacterium]